MKDLVRHPVVLVLAAVVLTLGLVCSLPAHAQAPPPDEATAELRALADQGHAGAQFNLGIIYGAGERVPEHEAEAVRWFRLAADRGFAPAQGTLGAMYATGRGVPQDDVTAHMWLNLAASRSTGGQREQAAKARDAVAERLTPEGRSEAQRLAREWDAAHPPREP